MNEHAPSLTVKTMFWIERFQNNGGMNGNTPHWNRIIGHSTEESAVEDLGTLRVSNPEQKFRLLKVTEEIVFP